MGELRLGGRGLGGRFWTPPLEKGLALKIALGLQIPFKEPHLGAAKSLLPIANGALADRAP
jgi:hypothetical protein